MTDKPPPDRRQRRLAFLEELAEARALLRRVSPRRAKRLRMHALLVQRTYRPG
jgi:hypothetical protein